MGKVDIDPDYDYKKMRAECVVSSLSECKAKTLEEMEEGIKAGPFLSLFAQSEESLKDGKVKPLKDTIRDIKCRAKTFKSSLARVNKEHGKTLKRLGARGEPRKRESL